MVTTLGLLPRAGRAELRHADRIAGEGPLCIGRGNAQLGVKYRNPKAAADRQRLVLRRLDEKDFLHLGQLFRHLCGEVVRLAPVLFQVVEFPDILVRRPLPNARRQCPAPTGARGPKARGHPAIVVDRAAAHDLEVLGEQLALGFRVVKGVGETDAVDWVLLDAVDRARRGDAENFVNRRDDIVAVMKLRARRRIGL